MEETCWCCGAEMKGSDHCPCCGCEEYERQCGSVCKAPEAEDHTETCWRQA